jgi:hypothetical protein
MLSAASRRECNCLLSRCDRPLSHRARPVDLGRSPEEFGACPQCARAGAHRAGTGTMFHRRCTPHGNAGAHSVCMWTCFLCKSFPTAPATTHFRCRCASIGRAYVLSGERSKQFRRQPLNDIRARARATRATIVDSRVRPHARTLASERRRVRARIAWRGFRIVTRVSGDVMETGTTSDTVPQKWGERRFYECAVA